MPPVRKPRRQVKPHPPMHVLNTETLHPPGRAPIPAGTILNATGPLSSTWIEADGRSLPRTEYPELYAAIGTTYGQGNGTDTFNIPDLRDTE